MRNPVWKDNYTLFTSDLKNSPNSVKLQAAVAGVLMDRAKGELSLSVKKALLGEAIEHLEEALNTHPSFANAWAMLGTAYWERDRDYEKAVSSYLKSLRFRPQHYNTYTNLGSVYNEAGEFAKAIECFQKAVELNPQKPEGYYYLGIVNENQKQPDLAINNYEKAIEADPQYLPAYKKVAFVCAAQKKEYDAALGYLRKAVDLGIADFSTYDSMGIIYGLKKDYNSAVKALETAIRLNPKNAASYLNLAVTYQGMGDARKAEDYFNKAYTMDPGLRK